jgi:hypothetical protein
MSFELAASLLRESQEFSLQHTEFPMLACDLQILAHCHLM